MREAFLDDRLTSRCWFAAWLACCLLFCVLAPLSAFAQAAGASPQAGLAGTTQVLRLTRAEAVRADWSSAAPPAQGWVPVTLMDFWQTRWPTHDGVVWYRLRWSQNGDAGPTALLLDYVCLANAVYLNGSLLARDRSLVEPLSRSWFKPQYFLVDAPLLHPGENTLLVRVSGLAAYQPGFGTVGVGDPATLAREYREGVFKRYEMRLINFAMNAVLGIVFLLIWMLRRHDTTYGWYALMELVGSIHGYSYIASSPWPFASTDAWQAAIAGSYLVSAGCYTMFLIRFADMRFPRTERALWLVCAAGLAYALLLPGTAGPQRMPLIVLGMAIQYASIFWFLARAWRSTRMDHRVLAACLLVPVAVSFHDAALFFGWIRSSGYILDLTSVVTLIGIAFALAYRFMLAMRRVEGFNAELRREVEIATDQLEDTLQRKHALELAHGRAGERLQLTRDLHDGFGGTLVGAIARLERGQDAMPKAEVVGVLKDMRDDLRLVIESTMHENAGLGDVLATLRHRSSRLLEAAEIDSRWRFEGLDEVELGSARTLDLLRLLQEAVTNAFKHSRARNVEVAVVREYDTLSVAVVDDGTGVTEGGTKRMPAASDGSGAGLSSMRMRAQRLGGRLQMDSTAAGTALRVSFPLAPGELRPALSPDQ